MSNFKVIAKDGNARVGVLTTAHGKVETPVFMPVGTQGTVKALTPEDLKTLGTQIILGNTYHLYLRPGHKLIKKMGGLHKFMNWDGPILTDSGGFQAFSLGAAIEHGVKKIGARGPSATVRGLVPTAAGPAARQPHDFPTFPTFVGTGPHHGAPRLASPAGDDLSALNPRESLVTKMTEEGVEFVSHLDGSKHLLTPELSAEVQLDLGSDICLALDELLSPMHDLNYIKNSLERTHRWELRTKAYFNKGLRDKRPLFFGILQGVDLKEIRQTEAKWISEQDFDGVSIGGSFGVSPLVGGEGVDWANSHAIDETMEWVVPLLPESWARHALGIGEVRDLFECIERGVDMFDCVAPMRRARNGSLYISPQNGGSVANKFVRNISNSEFKEDAQPIDPGCGCYTCQNFSRAYLRHLFLAKELLYYHLATIHNVYYIVNLVKSIRESIIDHSFSSLKKRWIN